MQLDPLVSIVTPSYNCARFIEETILSVKNQTYPQIEHIVMDGGSTDGTLDILRKYDDSITWVSEPDEGQSDAVNKGWKMAGGEILGWINADDTYVPEAVETAVKTFVKHPDVSMVYGDCTYVNESSMVIRQSRAGGFDLKRLLCKGNNIPQPTVFLRREVLNEVGYLDTSLHMVMDGDMWIRIGLKLKVKYIPCVLANFRICPGTKGMDDKSFIFGLDYLRIHDKIFSNPELPKKIRKLERQAYSCAHVNACSGHLRRHQRKEAIKHFAKAVSIYPLILSKPTQMGSLVISAFGRRASETADNWKSKVWR